MYNQGYDSYIDETCAEIFRTRVCDEPEVLRWPPSL